MKVMLIGSGGREHTLASKIAESKKVEKLYVLPGNAGTALVGENVAVSATDIDGIVKFAVSHGVDFAVVAPDDPLVLGAVDALNAVKVKCFGPNAAAALIEGSKVFAKNLMKKYGIPTAKYEVFTDVSAAKEYVAKGDFPIVIKADGLALGKGVFIAENVEQANAALDGIMCEKIFGKSGNSIVIEEFMQGVEISLLTFCDGKTIVPMITSMDHKKAQDGDKGANTGGMGAIAPNPYYTEKIEKECWKKILIPTLNALNAENRQFKGCLYFGLMLTKDGVKVVEYNCRFGDPETQAVLPLLKSDLFDIMLAVENGTLSECKVDFSSKHCCCVVLASKGYPAKYQKGFDFTVEDEIFPYVYFAGVKGEKGAFTTNGGRVAGVYAVADSLREAVDKAYERAEKVNFENKYFRKDIGATALKVK